MTKMQNVTKKNKWTKRLYNLLLSLIIVSLIPIIAYSLSSHPNMFVNNAKVDTIKSKIDANNEPWNTAYDNFIDRDLSFALSLADNPPSVVNGGPTPPTGDNHDLYEYNDGNTDCTTAVARYDYCRAIEVGRAVRALGLAYALTDDQAKKDEYADKTIKIIKVWTVDDATKLNPRFIRCGEYFDQSRIDIPITMPGMFYGADLIWDSPIWDNYPGIKDKFKTWVSDFISSARTCATYKDVTIGCNNICTWRLAFIASAAALVDDTANLEYTFDNWKSLVDYQIDSQGRMWKELERGKRALFYSTYAMNALIHTAEIARHHGVDLWGYKVPGTDRGLELALDYHDEYIINPSSWPNNPGLVQELTSHNAAIYELAYARYNKVNYRDVIDVVGRPMYENRNMGPVTLTHANIYVNTTEPTPTISPTPIVSPTPTTSPTPTISPDLHGIKIICYIIKKSGIIFPCN